MRGFTLLETMVSLAIASVITAAATTATMGIYRGLLAKEQQGAADEEARALLDQLGSGLFQIGGGLVRPWSAVSNGCFTTSSPACAAGAGRRLRYIDTNEDVAQVTIQSASDTSVVIALSGGECPLTTWPAGPLDVALLPTKASGGGWRAARCTKKSTTIGNCSCDLVPLTLDAAHGSVPVTPSPNELPAGLTAFPAGHFAGGVLTAAQIVTLTHDETTKQLFESRDFRNDGSYASRLLSDAVWQFRVQFGFDGLPEDGQLDQMTTAIDDRREWVTSLDSAASPVACAAAPAACATPTQALRTIRLGLIVGARSPARTTVSRASLFDDGPAPVVATEPRGVLLRASTTVITMRSLLVFN